MLVYPYWLSRYPVTNSQFQIFIEDGGYANREHWSPEGWKWLQQRQVTEPLYFHDHRYAAPNQPVVGVSWWEAEAFCRWAGGRLPSEQDWESAARGSEAREYPWDGHWEDGICNTYEVGLGSTSPVGLFPRSRQADFSLEDMAGNVWEWVSDKGLLCGGSWRNGSSIVRVTNHSYIIPDDRHGNLGFRVLLFLRQD